MVTNLSVLSPAFSSCIIYTLFVEISRYLKIPLTDFGRTDEHLKYCWFALDVTKIQTTKLSMLPRSYFHDVLEKLKTNFHKNFRFKRVLGFVIEYA